MAGKGALPFDHPQALGAVGRHGHARREPARARRGPRHRRRIAAQRFHDRLEDGVSASGRPVHQRQHHRVRCRQAPGAAARRRREGDARGMAAADGRAGGRRRRTASAWPARRPTWEQEVDRVYRGSGAPVISQGEVIGLLNEFTGPRDVIVNAAGSLPGDLHKLWRARDPEAVPPRVRLLLHGLRDCRGSRRQDGGARSRGLRARRRRLVPDDGAGDRDVDPGRRSPHDPGARQPRVRQHRRLVASRSAARGSRREYRCRDAETGLLDGDVLPVDFVANAESLGARAIRACTPAAIREALETARAAPTARRPS